MCSMLHVPSASLITCRPDRMWCYSNISSFFLPFSSLVLFCSLLFSFDFICLHLSFVAPPASLQFLPFFCCVLCRVLCVCRMHGIIHHTHSRAPIYSLNHTHIYFRVRITIFFFSSFLSLFLFVTRGKLSDYAHLRASAVAFISPVFTIVVVAVVVSCWCCSACSLCVCACVSAAIMNQWTFVLERRTDAYGS